MSGLKAVAAVAALLLVPLVMALAVRARVRRRPELRGRIIASSVFVILLAAVVGIWLPTQVPDTPGSPAMLVGIVVLWILGGVLFIAGLASLLGAVFAGRSRAALKPAPPA